MEYIKKVSTYLTESNIEIHVVCFGVYELCGMSTIPLFSVKNCASILYIPCWFY